MARGYDFKLISLDIVEDVITHVWIPGILEETGIEGWWL